MEEVFHYLPKEEIKKFLLNTVIPYTMSMEANVQCRDLMIEIAFMLLEKVEISDLTLKEYEQFLQAFDTK